MSGLDLDSFHRQVLKSFSQEYDGNDDNWDAAVGATADATEASKEEVKEVIDSQRDSQWKQLHAFLETDCGRSGQFDLTDVEKEVEDIFTESYSMWDDSEAPTEWISAETGLSQSHTNRILSRMYGTLLLAIEETSVDELYACVPSMYLETGIGIQDTGTYATQTAALYREMTDKQENEREKMVVIKIIDEDVAPRDLTEKQTKSEPEDEENGENGENEEVQSEQQSEPVEEYVIVDEVAAEQIQPYLF